MTLKPAFDLYPIATLRDLLFEITDRYGSRVALRSKSDGVFVPLTYVQLRRRVEELGTAFAAAGLTKGDRIGILSENRIEWVVAYLGTVASGYVAVPVDKDLKRREVQHILKLSEARAVVASGSFVGILQDSLNELPALEQILSMDGGKETVELEEFLASGRQGLREGADFFETARVDPEDLAAIIFTSGTTGTAKGVMLSHGNLASNVMQTSHNVAVDQDDVLLSVLPLHHTYECTAGFLTALYQGAEIWHAENLRRIPENLVEARASVMLGVPALFEAMYRKVEAGIAARGKRKFRLARGLATVGEKLFRVNLRRKIFSALHERFGGRLRLMISGGAAINPEVARGFRELGIDFIQGYGMTEHSPIISVNRVDHFRDASVGSPLPQADVQIVDNEITVAGPSVMQGYYRNEAATAEALVDGRLHTGDLGYFDKDGFLYISGRKKSVIVTPHGKNVYPEELEFLLNQSPFVLESLVWGGPQEDPAQTEVQAIVVPDTDAFDAHFGASGYDEKQVQELISKEVKKVNQELANFKKIRRFQIRYEEFEKTTTRKIKRYLYTAKPRSLGQEEGS